MVHMLCDSVQDLFFRQQQHLIVTEYVHTVCVHKQ